MQQQSEKNTLIKKIAFIAVLAVCATPWINSPMALVGGFVFVYFLGHPYASYTHKATSWLLKIAIVGLGFGMNLQSALNAGKEGFTLTVASIVLILLLGFIMSKVFKINRKTAHLISSGTAICGGSAIAAVGPTLNASEKEMSIALGIVFLLNAVALLVFPPIGHFLDMSEYQFGLWSAIAIHDTSSVVGAAATFGDSALHTATTVKLARALWIIPLALFTAILFKSDQKKVKIPWFIGLFFLAIVANTYLEIPLTLTGGITVTSKALLVITLFLIGSSLTVEKIKSVGWKPLLLGLFLWFFISVSSLLVILQL